MTAKQFNRQRKWDRKVQKSYQAGVMDGFDAFFEGRECPEPLICDYETKFYVRPVMRHAQEVTNSAIARSRGRYDGWHLAAREQRDHWDEEYIQNQVTQGMKDLVDYLRIEDRRGEGWVA